MRRTPDIVLRLPGGSRRLPDVRCPRRLEVSSNGLGPTSDSGVRSECRSNAYSGTRGATPPRARFGFMYVLDINGDGRSDILHAGRWPTTTVSAGSAEQIADGRWLQHVIDNTWSQAHASALVDLNGDGQPGSRDGEAVHGAQMGRTSRRAGTAPRLYWYEWRQAQSATPGNGGVEWVRHIVDYGEGVWAAGCKL